MRLRSVLLLAGTPLFAQFSQFVATDDGKQVYFTSPLVLYSSPASQNAESRLYRIGLDGVFLVAQRPQASTPVWFSGSGDGVSDPQVSGDGSLVGFTYRNLCPAAQNPCQSPIPAEAQLTGAQTADLGRGVLQLSRNGRWALLADQLSNPFPGATYTYALTDLATGQLTHLPQSLFVPARAIASDGSVLFLSSIWKQGKVTAIPFPAGSASIPQALSDNAATVIAYVYFPNTPDDTQLAAIDVASGRATTLYQASNTAYAIFMAMSNDGRRALYRVTSLDSASGTAYVADTSTGQSNTVPLPDGELAVDGTVSGVGDIVILATTLGRIVRVTLATGALEPLIPPTPYVSNLGQLAIGSLVHMQTTYPGTAADWTGQLLLGNQPLPVLDGKPGSVDIQVPWEEPSGPAQFHIAIQTGSPFQQFQQVFVSAVAPAFELLDPGQTAIFPVKIIKGDWSGLQTTQPKAGDIVHMYLTGLGPVSGPVQTGVPASLTSLNPLKAPLTCTFTPQTTPAETLFAGLAPGLIGIYQASFRIPADPSTQPFNGIQCKLGDSASFGFGILVGLVGPP